MISESEQAELVTLLQQSGKHGNYQMLPPCARDLEGRTLASGGMPRWEDRRFEWLDRDLPTVGDTAVLDIGANVGYFSLRLASDRQARMRAYEPYAAHARAIELLRELCGLAPDRLVVEKRGVALKDVSALPESRLVLLLNVLQHAGQDFDADLVRSPEEWRGYAIEYLERLGRRTEYLFFQLGYTWLGSRQKLCEDNDILDFTLDLVNRAGWNVVRCGLIRKLGTHPVYEDARLSPVRPNSVLLPRRRNPIRRLTRWLGMAPEAAARANRYRFAQRPLWLLRVKDE